MISDATIRIWDRVLGIVFVSGHSIKSHQFIYGLFHILVPTIRLDDVSLFTTQSSVLINDTPGISVSPRLSILSCGIYNEWYRWIQMSHITRVETFSSRFIE